MCLLSLSTKQLKRKVEVQNHPIGQLAHGLTLARVLKHARLDDLRRRTLVVPTVAAAAAAPPTASASTESAAVTYRRVSGRERVRRGRVEACRIREEFSAWCEAASGRGHADRRGNSRYPPSPSEHPPTAATHTLKMMVRTSSAKAPATRRPHLLTRLFRPESRDATPMLSRIPRVWTIPVDECYTKSTIVR